jgi:hypothetical protein
MEVVLSIEQQTQLQALKKMIMALKPGNGKHIYKMDVESFVVTRVHGNDYGSYVASLSERKEDVVPKLNHLYCVAKSEEKAFAKFGKIIDELSKAYENID